MTVTSTPGHGTTCTVYLPWYAEAVDALPPRREEGLPGGTERILFVDDEPAMAALGLEVLTRLGYQVVVCRSSAEALALFRTVARGEHVLEVAPGDTPLQDIGGGQFGEAQHDDQDIVEIMGNTTCQCADRLHFLGLAECVFQALLL